MTNSQLWFKMKYKKNWKIKEYYFIVVSFNDDDKKRESFLFAKAY